MKRLVLLTKSPLLVSILPFTNNDNAFDKPVAQTVIKPLDDEMGWDRVKKIFRLNEEGIFSKELQSIINVTLSGVMIGACLGGIRATKNTVDNFIGDNEATRFVNQFDAKRHLQQAVFINFLKKGVRFGGKLGLFCCMFTTLTTCTSAYRGKVAVENYIFGGAVTGFLYKMNLGLRAALVGGGCGGTLGAICGGLSILILTISGVTMDEVLMAQQEWVKSRDKVLFDKIKQNMEQSELPELKQMYEENLKEKKRLRIKQEKDAENCST